MTVNDGIEEVRTEEAIVENSVAGPPSAPPPISWRRFAYAGEFLLALLVVFDVWSQVGGQGHLDLIAWYIKFACAFAMACCIVGFNAGMAEHEKIWNPRTRLWFAGMLLLAVVMGGITYYYHLHEEPVETDSEDATATSVRLPQSPRRMLRM